MFFAEDRIAAVREMIVSKTVEQRQKALDKILPMQRGDFEELYRVLEGRPATIRFLDPPLHEFVPSDPEDIKALANDMGIDYDELKATIAGLHEFNPMLGHRGCRLDVYKRQPLSPSFRQCSHGYRRSGWSFSRNSSATPYGCLLYTSRCV